MIALIDYRAGNLTSVRKALAFIGAEVWTPATPDELGRARGVIVPGVGHFGATAAMDQSWHTAVGRTLAERRPLLGICLGMQWLFDGSDEAPELPGLGVLPGRCVRLTEGAGIKVPHVGWNSLARRGPSQLLEGTTSGHQAYFTHSYVVPESPATAALTTHGAPFPSVVERDLIFGVQFHPEKSAALGLRILRNFVARCT